MASASLASRGASPAQEELPAGPQPVHGRIHASVGKAEAGSEEDQHAGDAGLRLTDGASEGEAPVVDARFVPQAPAARQRLLIASWQTQPVQQEEGVSRRGPLGAVERAGPPAVRILPGQQLCAPSARRDEGAFGVDVCGGCVGQVAERLPADRRIPLEQPRDGVGIISLLGP